MLKSNEMPIRRTTLLSMEAVCVTVFKGMAMQFLPYWMEFAMATRIVTGSRRNEPMRIASPIACASSPCRSPRMGRIEHQTGRLLERMLTLG